MRIVVPVGLAIGCLWVAGCDAPVDHFPPNRVHALVVSASRQVDAELAAEDSLSVIDAWFGTPEQPRWPKDLLRGDAAQHLVDPDRLVRAAGRVYSDQENHHFGLYNEHCVTCHGVAGGGNGPASLLQNPYPRDFRAGVFKWKSTARSSKPTREDLLRILQHGAPGTAMPSFQTVAGEDLEALIDYVIFLSVRGEVERRLVDIAVDELGYEERRPDADASLLGVVSEAPQAADTDAADLAVAELNEVAGSWAEAPEEVVPVPDETPFDAASIERGRELFHGPIANCVGCHGPDGDGQAATLDYDDWTKEYTTRLAITPDDDDAVRPYRQAGALRPRQIHPRRLTSGVFRGGGDSQTLYRRLLVGIAGTPMPGVIVAQEPSATGLTAEQIWDLVHYIVSLSEQP
ncbi:cytochrome c [Roseiconus nitratireducens]|uniref:Cytochrome c n=1 Tax=Roseiconus nitratireducens TaxID=2605748 RepID=A0A5M6DA20_9BACT|nr:cytochrome c [Roseiconus nitratireducens]KAA5544397.1 cytochrome c [Roseiconus nitratireducens]